MYVCIVHTCLCDETCVRRFDSLSEFAVGGSLDRYVRIWVVEIRSVPFLDSPLRARFLKEEEEKKKMKKSNDRKKGID